MEQFRWTHWMTLTFDDRFVTLGDVKRDRGSAGYDTSEHTCISFESAMRSWKRFVSNRRWDGLGYFTCVEKGDQLGRTHLHTLAEFPLLGSPSLADFDAAWRRRYGLTHIRDYRAAGGAHAYAAKYCTKDLAEWDLRPRVRGSIVPQEPIDSRSEEELLLPRRDRSSRSSRSTRRSRAWKRRKLSQRVELTTSSWSCSNDGIEVIETGSIHGPRTPRTLDTLQTRTVSVGPSTSEIRTNGVR